MVQTNEPPEKSEKSYGIAIILCGIFGVLGIHHFYLGKIGTGILMLITLGGFGIWTIIDFVRLIIGSMGDKYGRPLKR